MKSEKKRTNRKREKRFIDNCNKESEEVFSDPVEDPLPLNCVTVASPTRFDEEVKDHEETGKYDDEKEEEEELEEDTEEDDDENEEDEEEVNNARCILYIAYLRTFDPVLFLSFNILLYPDFSLARSLMNIGMFLRRKLCLSKRFLCTDCTEYIKSWRTGGGNLSRQPQLRKHG